MSNAETSSSQTRQSGLRLHCFPDIPVDDSPDGRRCAPLAENFERSQFENIDSTCKNAASGLDDNENPHDNNTLSVAEIEEKAYREGFADGKKKGVIDGENAGFNQGLKKLEPILASLQQALLQLNQIRQETYHSIEKEVVELALAIAKKVICQEVKTDREVVVRVAREALSKIEDPGKIKIKMNPSDLQFINETKYQLTTLVENIANVTLQPEESIRCGGCIIETDLGEIDARIEKQVQAIEASFRTAMKKSSPGAEFS